MKESIKGNIIIILFILLLISIVIGLPIYLVNRISEAEFKMVKKGTVNNVEYVTTDGGLLSSGNTTTVLYFEDGAIVSVCGHKDVYNLACVKIYKVQNKICWYDYLEICK